MAIFVLHRSFEFEQWLFEQPLKARLQIEDRLLHIVCHGHFGTYKRLVDDIWELKWANGRRIYYTHVEKYNILLLLGGNKNGQSKDIAQAKKILRKYTEATA